MTRPRMGLALLGPLLAAGAASAFQLDLPRKFRLKNGMRLLVREDRSMPLVGFGLAVHAGAAHETADTRGAAALLAELWSDMEAHAPSAALARKLADRGVTWRATPDTLYVRAGMHVPPEEVGEVLRLVQQMLALRRVGADHLARAKERVLRSLRLRLDHPVEGGALEDLHMKLAYGDHPLARTGHGEPDAVRARSVDDLERFLEATLAPSRVTLVLNGDVDATAVLKQALQVFDGAAQPFRAAGALAAPVDAEKARSRTVFAEVETGAARVGFLVPPLFHEDFHALYLAKEILAQGKGSALHRRLVTREGRVKSVSEWMTRGPYDNLLTFHFVSQSDEVEGGVKAVLEECARLARRGVRPEVLERIRRGSKAVRALNRQSRVHRALYWGVTELSDDVDHALDFNAALDEVTPEDIRRVAGRYLTPERAVVAAMRPTSAQGKDQQAVVTRTMPKGLRVAVRREASDDVVGISLYLPGSMADEPTDKPGLAGLLEAMLAEGETRAEAPAVTAARLEESGGSIHGGLSGIDGIVLSISATVYTFDELLQTLHDVVILPRFDPATFERVKREYVEGWQEFEKNLEDSGLWLMYQTLFPQAPYGKPISEIVAKVPSYTLQDLEDFHAQVLARKRSALVVAGNVAPEKVFASVEGVRSDGLKVARGEARPAPRWPAFRPLTTTQVERRPSERPFDTVWVAFKLPPEARQNLAAGTVWFNVLGLGADAIFSRQAEAVDPAYQRVSGSLNVLSHGGGLILGYRVAAGKGEQLADQVRQRVVRLDAVQPTPAEIETTRRRISTYLGISAQDKVRRASSMALSFGTMDEPDFQQRLLESYRTVDAAQLEDFRERYLKHAHLVVFEASQ